MILLGNNSTAANIGNPNDGRDTTKASCMTGLTMAGAPIDDCMPSDEDSHSIGTVMFGNDGSLFVGSGDGSNYTAVDPRALRSQNSTAWRARSCGSTPLTGSGLPDNPFYDATCPTCNRSKVYAMGLRNPFRFTVHPVTNEVYIGDVGWNTWEEINTGKGANFGWPCYEGGAAGSPAPAESGVTDQPAAGSYANDSSTSAACAALYAQGPGAVRAPIFSYDHGGPRRRRARTAAPRPTAAPSTAARCIRRSTRTRSSSSTTTGSGSATSPSTPRDTPRSTTSARRTAPAWCRC